MPNYTNSKIYKLVNDIDDQIYVGSTTQSLAVRKGGHKRHARKYPDRRVYSHLNAIGWDSVRIILIENVNCQNAEELRQHEQRHIDLLRPSLNRLSAHVHCPHGRIHNLCVDCGGASICRHDRVRHQCVDCGGSQICQHNKRKNQCKDCSGIHCDYCNITMSKATKTQHIRSQRHIRNFKQAYLECWGEAHTGELTSEDY